MDLLELPALVPLFCMQVRDSSRELHQQRHQRWMRVHWEQFWSPDLSLDWVRLMRVMTSDVSSLFQEVRLSERQHWPQSQRRPDGEGCSQGLLWIHVSYPFPVRAAERVSEPFSSYAWAAGMVKSGFACTCVGPCIHIYIRIWISDCWHFFNVLSDVWFI